MPDSSAVTEGFPAEAFDFTKLPDYNTTFIDEAEINAFAKALSAPESSPLIALNDWRPIHQRVRRKGIKGRKKKPKYSKDETREGFVYTIIKWPLLLIVLGWIIALGLGYFITRLYIYIYERWVTWRGKRQELRSNIRLKTDFEEWKEAAQELDRHLGNEAWKEEDDYAYYDHTTVRKVKEQLKASRTRASLAERGHEDVSGELQHLRTLVEACVKNNFVGVENPRLYSETYYGTKHLAQEFVDELQESLAYLLHTSALSQGEKYSLARHLHTNFGRTALCLSGGATFAYYHFGVARALLDANLLPEVITGTSGGALVAALLATRTDEELMSLLVPALANHMSACSEGFTTWFPRWWRTGARFDSLEWARHCSWFCRGSTTFREAYERTGRILNVSCVPSDPHSPTILCNYLTSPDCVIWSAALASAAVPGILNPVVLMTKSRRDGSLSPYSFGHKWKVSKLRSINSLPSETQDVKEAVLTLHVTQDGSLRTDIPLKALNTQFNTQFSIVSQVNPHINLFFFSSRGAIGRPVTHRKGRGWRGGYLGSATETYLKLDLNKWLKVLKHLELLPRPLGQDWSAIWLQQFSGTITIWPKSRLSDFWYLLSDPSPARLARMIRTGEQSCWPKVLFIQNRMKIERLVEEGLLLGRRAKVVNGDGGGDDVADDESLHLHGRAMRLDAEASSTADEADIEGDQGSNRVRKRNKLQDEFKDSRRSSLLLELRRQSGVFFDDPVVSGEGDTESEVEEWASAVGDHEKMT